MKLLPVLVGVLLLTGCVASPTGDPSTKAGSLLGKSFSLVGMETINGVPERVYLRDATENALDLFYIDPAGSIKSID